MDSFTIFISLVLFFAIAVASAVLAGIVALYVWLTRKLYLWTIDKVGAGPSDKFLRGFLLTIIALSVGIVFLVGGFLIALAALAAAGTRRSSGSGYEIPLSREEPRNNDTWLTCDDSEMESWRRERQAQEAERASAQRARELEEASNRPHPAFGTDHPAF
ncbi:MAG: hypothetical protein SF066_15450 [Thermoanaerobaculia bacterium]|nr:hypothetical protein [Thermoanaerobaculia bacterium]